MKKYIIVPGDGDPCPRCHLPTENKMGGTPYAPRWRLIAKALREKVDREVAA